MEGFRKNVFSYARKILNVSSIGNMIYDGKFDFFLKQLLTLLGKFESLLKLLPCNYLLAK